MNRALSAELPAGLSVGLSVGLSAEGLEAVTAALAATDIAWLELRGPGVALCLRQDAGRVEPADPAQAPAHAASQGAAHTVKAASVGVYRHAHPLQAEPLARPGQAVRAGQVIGLLQVGALLLPVAAPQDGRLLAHLLDDGGLAGWGTPLATLAPAPAR